MVDPIFVTAGSVGFLCATVIVNITNFIRDVRGARKDLMAVCDELSSLRMTLDALCDDCNNPDVQIPPNLEQNLVLILENCNKVVAEIDATLVRLLDGGLRGKVEWTSKARDDVAKSKANLEAHKLSLSLVLDMIDMSITREIKHDTSDIKETTNVIHADLKDGHAKILERIEALQLQARTNSATPSKTSDVILPNLPELPAAQALPHKLTTPEKVIANHSPRSAADQETLNQSLWKYIRLESEPVHDETAAPPTFQQVRSILQQGADPNATDEKRSPSRRWTPLHEASFDGNYHLVGLLLEFGADANTSDTKKRSPLHMCSTNQASGDAEQVAKMLVEKGNVNVNARDHYGSTPLHTMTYVPSSGLLRYLIDVGADVNAADNEGRVPLTRAIAYGCTEDVRLLIDRGADIYKRDQYGRSILEVARQDVESGMVGGRGSGLLPKDMLRLLSEYGLNLFQG